MANRPPFLKLSCAVQTYAWGKVGPESEVAKLKSGDPSFTVNKEQTYAEVGRARGEEGGGGGGVLGRGGNCAMYNSPMSKASCGWSYDCTDSCETNSYSPSVITDNIVLFSD